VRLSCSSPVCDSVVRLSVCGQCRERGVSYSGRIMVRCGWKVDGVAQAPFERYIGQVPIMVKVNCNKHNFGQF